MLGLDSGEAVPGGHVGTPLCSFRCGLARESGPLNVLPQRAPPQAPLLRLPVEGLLADLPLPEVSELVAAVPAEDLPADVLAVHPLEERSAKPSQQRSPGSGGAVSLPERDLAGLAGH